jgi:hypothetical protein
VQRDALPPLLLERSVIWGAYECAKAKAGAGSGCLVAEVDRQAGKLNNQGRFHSEHLGSAPV